MKTSPSLAIIAAGLLFFACSANAFSLWNDEADYDYNAAMHGSMQGYLSRAGGIRAAAEHFGLARHNVMSHIEGHVGHALSRADSVDASKITSKRGPVQCAAAVAQIQSLMNGSCSLAFFANTTMSSADKVAAATAFCNNNCSGQLLDLGQEIVAECDLTEQQQSNVQKVLEAVRIASGLLCLKDTAGNLCYSSWLQIADVLSNKSKTFEDIVAVASTLCSECTALFFQRVAGYISAHNATARQELITAGAYIKLLCMKDFSNTTRYCAEDFAAFKNLVDSPNSQSETADVLKQGFELICSRSRCIQRFVRILKYGAQTYEEDLEALIEIATYNNSCLRNSQGELCAPLVVSAVANLTKDIQQCKGLGVDPKCTQCKTAISTFVSSTGCCLRPGIEVALYGLDRNATSRNETKFAFQAILGYSRDRCMVTIPDACPSTAVVVPYTLRNVDTSKVANKTALLQALYRDLLSQGFPEQGTVSSTTTRRRAADSSYSYSGTSSGDTTQCQAQFGSAGNTYATEPLPNTADAAGNAQVNQFDIISGSATTSATTCSQTSTPLYVFDTTPTYSAAQALIAPSLLVFTVSFALFFL